MFENVSSLETFVSKLSDGCVHAELSLFFDTLSFPCFFCQIYLSSQLLMTLSENESKDDSGFICSYFFIINLAL